jgi:hypothetical protein
MEDPETKKRCKELNLNFSSADLRGEISDLEILRKAYELVLENSDFFFSELGKAFTNENNRHEFKPLI